MGTLDGHIAILSGGLGDIGRAIASELAGRGAVVAIGDLHAPTEAVAFLDAIRKIGGQGRYDRVDVADAEAVEQWVAGVEGDLGIPNLVIPNAAIVTLADIRTVTPAQWSRELRVNLDGAFHLAQAGARRLLARGATEHDRRPGRIVFVGSWAGHVPHPHIPAYCVAKAGLRMLCRCMALDLASRGILVNEVAPGYVDAGLSGRIFEAEPERRERAAQQVPVRRLIEPDEVAAQVAHLCDPHNRNITGSVLLLDGGLSLLSGGMSDDG